MASRGHVERDFLGMDSPDNNRHQPRLDRRQSFRGISKINPEIVKSVMASAAKGESNTPSSVAVAVPEFPQLPVYQPFPTSRGIERDGGTESMTIFYNGTVSVFDLPKDKIESILKFAMEKSKSSKQVDEAAALHETMTLESINDGDLPIKRKKSLQRFFEKRKERLISVSPYVTQHVSINQFPQKTVA